MDKSTNIENKEPWSRAERIEQMWWAAAALSAGWLIHLFFFE